MSKKLTDFFVSSSKEKTTLLEENEQGASNSKTESNSVDDIGSHNVATNDSIEKPSIHRSHFHFQKQNLAKKIDPVKHHGWLNFPGCIMMQSKFIPYIWLLEKIRKC